MTAVHCGPANSAPSAAAGIGAGAHLLPGLVPLGEAVAPAHDDIAIHSPDLLSETRLQGTSNAPSQIDAAPEGTAYKSPFDIEREQAVGHPDLELPAGMQHALFSAYVDVHLTQCLDRQLRPLRLICNCLLMGRQCPPVQEGKLQAEEGSEGRGLLALLGLRGGQRQEPGEGSPSKPRQRHVPSAVLEVLSVAICALCAGNAVRMVWFLPEIGAPDFPWVQGIIAFLWGAMVAVCAIAFVRGSGLNGCLVCWLKELQARKLYFTSAKETEVVGSKIKLILSVGIFLTSCNIVSSSALYFVLGKSGSDLRQLSCYPMLKQESEFSCTAYLMFFSCLMISLSAYWIISVVVFGVLAFAFQKAYQQMAIELRTRLHWSRTAEIKMNTQQVVEHMMLRHEEMNDLVKRAAKHWKWFIAAVLSFDVPLITFVIYEIIVMIKRPGPVNVPFLLTMLFWALSGLVHMTYVALNAAYMTLQADELGRMMLKPTVQRLLKDNIVETQMSIQVFNKYLDAHPPCFELYHIKITQDFVGTMYSLILGYVIVLATL